MLCKLVARGERVENRAAHPYLGVKFRQTITTKRGYANGKVQETQETHKHLSANA